MTDHISCAICGSVARPSTRDEGFGICDLCWYADELPLANQAAFDLEQAAHIHDHVGDCGEDAA